jgi:hypothetical protein
MTYFKKSIKENFDTMKKNVMLKIASVLMVAVLLTTCAISSTFAKYVTSGTKITTTIGEVAHWGLKIEGTSNEALELFQSSYDNKDGTITVQAATDKTYLVAPGTTNESDAFKIAISGTPEVAYRLYAKADLNLGTNWNLGDSSKYYCPLAITVTLDNEINDTQNPANNIETTTFYGNNYNNEAEFEAAVEEFIYKAVFGVSATKKQNPDDQTEYYVEYGPNTEAVASANGISVSWIWNFDETADAKAKQSNASDTILGDAADKASIQLTFNVRAEQID